MIGEVVLQHLIVEFTVIVVPSAGIENDIRFSAILRIKRT